MRKLIALVAFAAVPILPSQAALAAQRRAAAQDGPTITVEGDRMVCRRVTRTATRMRTGRVCRSRDDLSAHPDGAVTAGSYDEIGDAYFKASGMFEPCPYDPGRTAQNPLGPR